MRAGIAIDDWKLNVFERHLVSSGYAYSAVQRLTGDMVLLVVETPNLRALGVVVKAANDEARRIKDGSERQ